MKRIAILCSEKRAEDVYKRQIVDVVDASALERNPYLTLQLLELGKPVVVALNMMDIVEERGMEIDLHRLPELLGNIPVVPVSARKRTGLDVLLHAVEHHYEEQKTDSVVVYSPEIEEKIEKISQRFQEAYPDSHNAVSYTHLYPAGCRGFEGCCSVRHHQESSYCRRRLYWS